tara:strand:- start:3074 stop:5092 length:2019 start_codon:yes stop_codon:yes gene_type:complete
MTYQNPHLLYALFAIAIPIIIHLFNFRKHKTIYFSSVRFLKKIKEENKKTSELKNILVLLSRILAISFLVIAFAKPYIPTDSTQNPNDILLYLDNSQSMDVDFGKGNLLNNAKSKAIEIVQAYTEENNFYLITNDFESRDVSNYTADLMKLQIDKIEPSARQRSVSDIIARANSIKTENSHLYFISDFQQNSIKINNLKEQKINNKISLIPIVNNNTKNISIDSLFTSGPVFISDNEVELHVIISNTGNEDIENEVLFLHLDNKQKSQQYINLLAKETKEIIFNFSPPSHQFINGEIKTHDSPITFDNSLFFTLTKAEKINISIINKEIGNKALKAIFGNDTALFNLTSMTIKNINYNTLMRQNFIILNEVVELSSGLLSSLLSFTNNGGSLLIIPPSDLASFSSYNILLNSLGVNTINRKKENRLKINQFSTNHPIYNNVFSSPLEKVNYPISNQNYVLNSKKMSTQIIGLANKEDFLSVYTSKNGCIYQFSSPLNNNYNNFTRHALFVPTLINMATSSILVDRPYYIIGSNREISTKHINTPTSITHIKGENIDIIPTLTNKDGKQLLDPHNQIVRNGIYSVINNNLIVDKIAFNYNNSEGITSALDTDEIQEFISTNNIENISIVSTKTSNLKKIIQEQETGKEYWKIALLISLICFALEIILIKLIKI